MLTERAAGVVDRARCSGGSTERERAAAARRRARPGLLPLLLRLGVEEDVYRELPRELLVDDDDDGRRIRELELSDLEAQRGEIGARREEGKMGMELRFWRGREEAR